LIALLLGAMTHLRHVNATAAALILVLAVVCMALAWGWLECLLAAVAGALGLDYFFLPPTGSFGMHEPQHWVTFVAFLVIALATGQLSARMSSQKAEAVRHREEIEGLYRLSNVIAEIGTVEALVKRLGDSLVEIFRVEAVAIYVRATGRIERSGISGEQIADEQLRQVASSGSPFSDPEPGITVEPIRDAGEIWGSIGVLGQGLSVRLLGIIVQRVGAAISRLRLADQSREAEIARKADELRSAVFDALAHEAKGPLGTINIAATTLLSDRPGDVAQQREMVTIIKEEVERLRRWIDDTVRMSSTDPSQLMPNKAPHDVRNLVASALNALGPRTSGRRIRVELAESQTIAHCDAELIHRVLYLLLDNAIKYSPPGSPIAITATPDDDTGMMVLTVADAGPGVPADEQARIFEKHYRGSLHNSRVPGMGLGLSSARCLVASHGGEIWVTNRPEGGAAFHFSLPSSDGVPA
jgi:two-component system sensor histidine kinase KdpD